MNESEHCNTCKLLLSNHKSEKIYNIHLVNPAPIPYAFGTYGLFLCIGCHLGSDGSRSDTCTHFCSNRQPARKQGNTRCSPYTYVQLLKQLKMLNVSLVACFNSIHKRRNTPTTEFLCLWRIHFFGKV